MIIIFKPGFIDLKEEIMKKLNLPLDSESKTQILSKEEAKLFYKEHEGKPFIEELVSYIISGLSTFVKIENNDKISIEDIRKRIGNTDPKLAERGTIRSEYGKDKMQNCVHCSDSIEASFREEKFFNEILD